MFNPMILSTVNSSIGNKKNHLTVDELCNLFKKKSKYTELDKYVIDIIQTESSKCEIESFAKNFNISKKDIGYILSISSYSNT